MFCFLRTSLPAFGAGLRLLLRAARPLPARSGSSGRGLRRMGSEDGAGGSGSCAPPSERSQMQWGWRVRAAATPDVPRAEDPPRRRGRLARGPRVLVTFVTQSRVSCTYLGTECVWPRFVSGGSSAATSAKSGHAADARPACTARRRRE
jgi:hypothetical protein